MAEKNKRNASGNRSAAKAKRQFLDGVELEAEPALTPPPEHKALTETLLRWFAANKRPLPWRGRYTPYEVWVSEILLQQTQMERGVDYFVRWMERFPDIASVAAAHEDEVLKAWEGLGYYSRARNLHKTAQILARDNNGAFPDDFASLRALPGIGDYTAGAILSIAFNQPHPAVDANVERVFARLFDIDAPVKSVASADFIRHMAAALIPPGKAREFNQALMELGALVCRKKPKCDLCPLAGHCAAHRLGIAGERPVPGKKIAYSALHIVCGVLAHKGRVFIQKRLDSGVWAGFWEFPGGRLEQGESPEQGSAREFAEETEFAVRIVRQLGVIRHAYTRYRILMHCFLCELEAPASGAPPALDAEGYPVPVLHAATAYRWVRPEELEGYALPAAHRKLADTWMEDIAAVTDEG